MTQNNRAQETQTLYIKGVGLYELVANNLSYAESQKIVRDIEDGKHGESIIYHITHQVNSGGVDVGNNTYAVYQLIVDNNRAWQHTTESQYGNAREFKDSISRIQNDVDRQLCNIRERITILTIAAFAGLLYVIWNSVQNAGFSNTECWNFILILSVIGMAIAVCVINNTCN